MDYEKDIIVVLREAGEKGLPVRRVVRHVFNAHNSFFETTSKETVAGVVQRYLSYHSQYEDDTIEKVRFGIYRLNMKSARTRSLLRAIEGEENADSGKPPVSQELSLF